MKNHSSQLGIPTLLVILSVFATGCFWGDKIPKDAPCDCPNTERIARTTDWFGDLTVADSFFSDGSGAEGAETPQVNLDFTGFSSLEAARAALFQLEEHFRDAGVPLQPHLGPDTSFVVMGDARVTVWAPLVTNGNDALFIEIKVEVFADDSDPVAALAPFVEALGTVG